MMEVLILINPIPLVWRTILGVAALWYGWRCGGGGAQGETALNSHQLKGGNVKNAVDSTADVENRMYYMYVQCAVVVRM